MPVLRGSMISAPSWCELEHFETVTLAAGHVREWHAKHRANMLVVVQGSCRVGTGGRGQERTRGSTIAVAPGKHSLTSDDETQVMLLGGHWGDDCGGAGLFGVARSDDPRDIGDPVTYPKHTNFDRHYHDCDEYWILVSGCGTAVSEDMLYDVGPGDCVATRMGVHHDFPLVEQPVLAVFFETTMRGDRRGHLWEHTHGTAVPAGEAVGGDR